MISGCKRLFNCIRFASSAKTIEPSLARFRLPSSFSTVSPNASQTDFKPFVPGWTTSRAISSASMTCPPSSAKTLNTKDLPTAIDPVRPTFSMLGTHASGVLNAARQRRAYLTTLQTPPPLRRLQSVLHQHGHSKQPDPARYRGSAASHAVCLSRMDVANQGIAAFIDGFASTFGVGAEER